MLAKISYPVKHDNKDDDNKKRADNYERTTTHCHTRIYFNCPENINYKRTSRKACGITWKKCAQADPVFLAMRIFKILIKNNLNINEMKKVKLHLTWILSMLACTLSLQAQNNYVEKTIPLSKSACKGYMYDCEFSESGDMKVVFKYSDKKKELYETYSVDNSLGNVNQKTDETIKDKSIVKEDYSTTGIYASIGGSNSFDVLSTKLKLFKVTYNYAWNKNKQRYNRSVANREKVVIKNVDDRSYEGFIDFGNSSNGELMVLTGVTNKKEKNFYLLNVKPDLSFNEIPVKLDGNHSLVYACTIQKNITDEDNEFDISKADMIFIFAPNNKEADTKKYTYLRVNNTCKIIDQYTFAAPSPNLIITEAKLLDNGNVMLFGAYTKTDKAFEYTFGEYGPITSPGYIATDNAGNQNLRMSKYNRNLEGNKMVAMVVMNMKQGGVEWTRDIPVKDIEAKLKKAPEQKKAPVYNGKSFKIQEFVVAPNGDLLVSGQLTGTSLVAGNFAKTYKELICFHFDKTGELKAQYGYEPESIDDKNNTIFQIQQDFIAAADGKNVYWVVLENKSEKGYADFWDAYNGVQTFYPVYYPSIVKINTETASISNMEELGKRKYRLNKDFTYFLSKKTNTLTFVGRDKDNKNLWLCNYKMQ